MIQQDTIRLLRECDAGIQMGVQAIGDALPHARSEKLKKLLENGQAENQRMQRETDALLRQYQDEGKSPPCNRAGHGGHENQGDADLPGIRRSHCRSDDGWMQHGREIPEQVSESVRCGG